VAHLSFPFEVPMQKVHAPLVAYPLVRRAMASVPTQELLVEAAKRIDAAERPVVLAGKGARASREALLALAEKGSIPVVNTLPGKGVVPDEHPLALGGLGLLGARPAHTAMEQTDLCIMVGTSYPYLEFLPKPAQVIQLDWEASQIGKRYPVDVGLVGSAEPTLRLLAEAVHPREDHAWADRLGAARQQWFEAVDEQAKARVHRGHGVHPQWVADRLSQVVDENANISVDVGNSVVWMARNFRIRNHGWLVSSWLGSMGFGMPAAIAAKLAQPDLQSVAAVGDGGFAMLMADFATAVKYDLPIVVVVFNNQRLGMIKFEQEGRGMPEFGTRRWNLDFADFAEGAGGKGIRVDRAEEVEEALRQALRQGVPTVVDIATDANEKPLPPRISFDQARGYAEALFRETFGL